MSEVTGKPMSRVDGWLKVTGAARYSAEVTVANVAHGVIIQSTIAKGRIRSIDTREAERAPGVLGIVTHLNAPKLGKPNSKPTGELSQNPDQGMSRVLQDPVVHYSGQHIGVVVADTLERATHAAALVKVSYDEEKPITILEANLARAFPPSSGKVPGEEPADSTRGNPAQGLAAADVRIEQTYTIPVEHHNPLEASATIAVWEGRKLTVYDATQWVFGVRQALAATLSMREEDVCVVSHFVGGAFGCKGRAWPHIALAALAARHLRRPVKLVLTREQMYTSVGYHSQTLQRLALGATRDGCLTGIVHSATMQASPFDEYTESACVATRRMYDCPNVATTHRLVRVNTGTPTSMRARQKPRHVRTGVGDGRTGLRSQARSDRVANAQSCGCRSRLWTAVVK